MRENETCQSVSKCVRKCVRNIKPSYLKRLSCKNQSIFTSPEKKSDKMTYVLLVLEKKNPDLTEK